MKESEVNSINLREVQVARCGKLRPIIPLENCAGILLDCVQKSYICIGILPANSRSRQRPLQHSLEVLVWGMTLAEAPWVVKSAEAQWVQGRLVLLSAAGLLECLGKHHFDSNFHSDLLINHLNCTMSGLVLCSDI